MKKSVCAVRQWEQPLLFRPGETHTIRFSCPAVGRNPHLLLRGEPAADPIHLSEAGSAVFCRDIDDALSTDAVTGRFSLRFPAWEDPDPRRAWYRVLCAPMTYPGGFPVRERPEGDVWQLSLYVKGEDFLPLGTACLRAEFYAAAPGRDARDISGEPERVVTLDFPAGSYGFRRLETALTIPAGTACVLLSITVGESRGTLWVDSPCLCGADDRSLLPSFAPASRDGSLSWTAENLARGDRNDMILTLNGQTLGKHSLFASIYRWAQNEIPLPQGFLHEGENELTLCHVPDSFCPYPYRLSRVLLTWEDGDGAFSAVACPHIAAVGETFPVVIETFRENVTLTCRSDSAAVCPTEQMQTFAEPGLHAVRFRVQGAATDVRLTFTDGTHTGEVCLARTVVKRDRVLVGTSDAVYIPQTRDAMREFLKTYFSGEWGNFITFRPVYHWSGTRSCRAEVWQELTRFLSEAEIPYALLFDERELEGLNANPTRQMLESPYFLGFQGHERDGAYYYWGDGMFGRDGEFFRALRAKKLNHPDVSYRLPPRYRNGRAHLYRDPDGFDDMAGAAQAFERDLTDCLRGFDRHTGVTLLFRHFYRAGIEVAGAELMYGSHEILLSGLRGSALAYGKRETLAHLALQWHAEPVGGAAYVARYALSLRLAYLHGITQINTEEGLWQCENGFRSHDRFSPVCTAFAETERAFLRYVSGHSRTGTPARRHALLYGANESFAAYTDCPAWNKDTPGWEYGSSDRSWEQIRLFYPAATMTHPRAGQRWNVTQEPGWYSPSPLGLCDILPVEAPAAVLAQYPYLAFVGYNTMDPGQLERLKAYVRGGGKLLLCLCHLSAEVGRHIGEGGAPCLVPGYETLVGDAACGEGVRLVRNRLGAGDVLTVTSYDYPVPGTPCGEVFRAALKQLAEDADRSAAVRVEIGTEKIGYSLWEEPDGRVTVQLCGVAWDAPESVSEAWIECGGERFRVPVRPCRITTVTVSGDRTVAAAIGDEVGEVLELARGEDGRIRLTVQGEGICRFSLYDRETGAQGQVLEADLTNRPCLTLTLPQKETCL